MLVLVLTALHCRAALAASGTIAALAAAAGSSNLRVGASESSGLQSLGFQASGVQGFRVWGSGFWGSGFRISGFRVWGFRVQGFQGSEVSAFRCLGCGGLGVGV